LFCFETLKLITGFGVSYGGGGDRAMLFSLDWICKPLLLNPDKLFEWYEGGGDGIGNEGIEKWCCCRWI
jgi:hypothetical protein